MTSLDEIWVKLSTDDIGFYTRRTAHLVPARPGVYGWFFPLRIGPSADDMLRFARRLLAYDAHTQGVATWSEEKAGFNWDPLVVSVSRSSDHHCPDGTERNWQTIHQDAGVAKAFRQALMIGTIFARPIYVGLAGNIKRRYQDHVSGRGGDNTFHSRFVDYMKTLGRSTSVDQLLFVAIPLRGGSQLSKEQTSVLESILKVICQPVFGDR